MDKAVEECLHVQYRAVRQGHASQVLAPYSRDININDKVMALYMDNLLPGITQPGTDNNYGSSAMYDVLALQVRIPPALLHNCHDCLLH